MNTATTIQNYINTELRRGKKAAVALNDELLLGNVIDSLSIMRLVTYIESQFAIKVKPADVTIQNFRTIDILSQYVERTQVA